MDYANCLAFLEKKNPYLLIVLGKAESGTDKVVLRGSKILVREDKNNPNGLFLPQAA